jgi:hypothetical protein
MLEYVPLMLALAVLIKVEASLYDGRRDNEIYRSKLAEHCHRTACGKCLDKAEPLHREAQDTGEKSQEADGRLR